MSVKDTHSSPAEYPELYQAAEELLKSKSNSLILVEDTAAHAALIKRILEKESWNITHATRGDEALQHILVSDAPLVLLDLSLPDISGLELIDKIFALKKNAQVVIVTSQEHVETSVTAMKKGACDYVVKTDPQNIEEKLLSSVHRARQLRIQKAEAKLIEKTKVLERVNAERLAAIETLVRTVCHEVNNPLSGVVALSQILLEKEDIDENLKNLINEIATSAHQVANVVKKLSTIGDTVIEFSGRELLSLEKRPS